MSEGAELIAAERKRQIESEGWTPEHDNKWTRAELLMAAVGYTREARDQIRWGDGNVELPYGWPWSPEWWKPSDDPIRNLQKAGALIAAEIDRLKRIDAAKEVRGEQ